MPKKKSLLNAVKWSYTATWGERAFSALFTFILAALLGPRDFGVISIALVYIGFLQMFLDQGLVAALIQKKDLEHEHLDAVFWVDMALSFVLVGTSFLLSKWWGHVNHAPQVALVISVLSLCIPIEGLAIVQKTLLTKEMDFKSLSVRSNVSVLLSGVIGIGLAYLGYGVWALVVQQIVRDLTALVLLWTLSRWRPRFAFSWNHLKDLMSFSTHNFVAQLGIFADSSAGTVLLGLFFGPVAVGLYRFADRLMNTVIVTATSSIQWVSLPEFSRVQDNPDELRKSALTFIRLSSTVTLPGLAGLAAVSGALMATVGPKWIAAASILRVLCVVGMFLMFAFFTGPLLQALSKVRLLAILEWSRTAVGLLLLLLAGLAVRQAPIGSQIMAIAVARFVTTAFLVTPVFVYLLVRYADIPLRDLLATAMPSVLTSATITLAVYVFQLTGWLSGGKPAVLLVAEIVVGCATGIPILLLLDVQARNMIVGLAKRILGFSAFAKTVA
jgi:PST family polysaccharide transporter